MLTSFIHLDVAIFFAALMSDAWSFRPPAGGPVPALCANGSNVMTLIISVLNCFVLPVSNV